VPMCLIAFAWRTHPRWPLVLMANRDEFHGRPAAPAAFLADAPDVFGGIDLRAGGSWLLASRRRRLAAVTNVRVGLAAETAPRSRGDLVRDFAASRASAPEFLDRLASKAGEYGRFNLLLWDGASMHCASNHPTFGSVEIAPGLHALSNASLNTGWPKALRAKGALSAWLDAHAADPGASHDTGPLFAALADTVPAPDAELPDTGVGLELERRLSPPFVLGETYGTRCSTLVLVESGRIVLAERRFGPDGVFIGDGEIEACEA